MIVLGIDSSLYPIDTLTIVRKSPRVIAHNDTLSKKLVSYLTEQESCIAAHSYKNADLEVRVSGEVEEAVYSEKEQHYSVLVHGRVVMKYIRTGDLRVYNITERGVGETVEEAREQALINGYRHLARTVVE